MTRPVRDPASMLRLLGALLVAPLALTALPSPVRSAPPPAAGPPAAGTTSLLMLDAQQLAGARLDGRERRFRVPLDESKTVELTIDPRTQKMADRVLSSHEA